jgi:hypothetical protein
MRIVRRLLIKGANKDIVDRIGYKPIDYAHEFKFKSIERML